MTFSLRACSTMIPQRRRLTNLASSSRMSSFFFLMMGLHAKDYYAVPVYPVLFAAGGLAWEGWQRGAAKAQNPRGTQRSRHPEGHGQPRAGFQAVWHAADRARVPDLADGPGLELCSLFQQLSNLGIDLDTHLPLLIYKVEPLLQHQHTRLCTG